MIELSEARRTVESAIALGHECVVVPAGAGETVWRWQWQQRRGGRAAAGYAAGGGGGSGSSRFVCATSSGMRRDGLDGLDDDDFPLATEDSRPVLCGLASSDRGAAGGAPAETVAFRPATAAAPRAASRSRRSSAG